VSENAPISIAARKPNMIVRDIAAEFMITARQWMNEALLKDGSH
jgi:hypothetical protein